MHVSFVGAGEFGPLQVRSTPMIRPTAIYIEDACSRSVMRGYPARNVVTAAARSGVWCPGVRRLLVDWILLRPRIHMANLQLAPSRHPRRHPSPVRRRQLPALAKSMGSLRAPSEEIEEMEEDAASSAPSAPTEGVVDASEQTAAENNRPTICT